MLYLMVIISYFVLLVLLGIFNAKKASKSSDDYLIAGRSLGLMLATASIVGEWLGAMSTIGTSERAFSSGFSPMWYNLSTALGMVIFSVTLASIYRKNNVHTVGEMVEKIYSKSARIFVSLALVIAFFVLSFIQLKGIGAMLSRLLSFDIGNFHVHVSPELSIVIAGIIVTAYVFFGGLWSISSTNVLHVVLMYSTLILAFIVGLVKVGGYHGLFEKIGAALAAHPDWFRKATVASFKSPVGIGYKLILSFLLGGTFSTFASQAAIQPVFATKDIKTARNASLLSAAFIAPLGFIVATLGMIGTTGMFGYPLNEAGMPIEKEILPYLFTNSDFLPPILGSLAMAGILAAILSTIAPVMFSVSTILTRDVYGLFINKNASDKDLLKFSRAATAVIGFLIIPCAIAFHGYILDTAYLSYAIRDAASIIVLLGVFWVFRKGNEKYNFVTEAAVKTAIIVATVAACSVVVFGIIVKSKNGLAYWNSHYGKYIFFDKVYISLITTTFFSIVISVLDKRKRPYVLEK